MSENFGNFLQKMKINKRLIWDYDFSEKELKSEMFLKWYIVRVLERGTDKDLQEIGIKNIFKYLKELNLSRSQREFWEWYFSSPNVRKKYGNSH